MRNQTIKILFLIFFLHIGQLVASGQSQSEKVLTQKGTLLLDINVPYINSFSLHPENEVTQQKIGFLGFGLGADYYVTNKIYFNLSGKGVIDFLAPVPAPVRYDSGSFYFFSTNYLQLTLNRRLRRLHFGGGVIYGQNSWRYRLFGEDRTYSGIREIDKVYSVGGLIGTFSYKMGKSFYLSLAYRPTLIQFLSQPTFRYEHLASVEFGWKIRVKK